MSNVSTYYYFSKGPTCKMMIGHMTSIHAVSDIAGLCWLEIIRPEAITLPQSDRQGVQTTVRHTRPGPAHTRAAGHHAGAGHRPRHVDQRGRVQPHRGLRAAHVLTGTRVRHDT